ncbi:MAG: septum formation initiator family protein [Culicoidibacterales bacterium]
MMVSKMTMKRQEKNASQRRKMKKKTNRQLIVVGIAFFTFLFCVGASLPKVIGYMQSQQKYQQIQNQYEIALNEQATLEIELKKAEDPNYIQQYAREKYFLSNPGEILLVLPNPPQKTQTETEQNWLEKFLAFFSRAETDQTQGQ